MSQIQQISVARPLQADPRHAARALGRRLATHPIGRQLLNMASTPALKRPIDRALGTLAATDHLTFKALPSQSWVQDRKTLTVLTANLWHDWPRYRKLQRRLEALARLVETEQAQVILLQEVARTADIQVDEWLARRLGMAYVYGQANGDSHLGSFEEGVAVLSRYPLADPGLCHLAPRPWSLVRRVAVGVTVKAPGGEFLAVSVHLGHGRRLNTRQLDAMRDWVGEQGDHQAAVIGGDFNAGEDSPQIQDIQEEWIDLYRTANPLGDGATYQLRWPWGNVLMRRRLDYLFLRPGHSSWRVLEARAVETAGLAHSDHQAVVARLVPGQWSRMSDISRTSD